MKRDDLAEMRKIDIKALNERVRKTRGEIAELSVSKSTKKNANLKEVKNKRRGIAQMLTVMRQKQLLEELEVNNG